MKILFRLWTRKRHSTPHPYVQVVGRRFLVSEFSAVQHIEVEPKEKSICRRLFQINIFEWNVLYCDFNFAEVDSKHINIVSDIVLVRSKWQDISDLTTA